MSIIKIKRLTEAARLPEYATEGAACFDLRAIEPGHVEAFGAHTGITQLFWAGLKIEEVAQVSGHTNWTQLKRYTHIRPEDVHRRWEALQLVQP